MKPLLCKNRAAARRVKTQSNHIFTTIAAAFKLERLNMKQSLYHFVLKGRLYLTVIKAAFAEWKKMVGV
ncbi:MAG: hypothetical protein GY761_02575 [Hyphomicrobiales bacterium]|nr:hypothetical protein [Hyphomicrobiales bacterium]